MKIAVMAGLFAKGDVDVDACHGGSNVKRFSQCNFTKLYHSNIFRIWFIYHRK